MNHANIDASFTTLAMSIASSAAMNLGLAPNPETNKSVRNIEMARFNIDLLDVLEVKTKGNLSKEEHDFLENVLSDLKMKFLEVSKGEKK